MIKEAHKQTPRRAVLMLVAIAVAMVLASFATVQPAQGAFHGANGAIIFVSGRTTGSGVSNPQGETEIFSISPDSARVTQLTTNDTGDSEPPPRSTAPR